VFQSRDGYIENVLKFLCHTKELDCVFRLLAKVSIDSKGRFCVDMRHFEIVL
jgi:hypothetical protein